MFVQLQPHWAWHTIAVPAFLAVVAMPFTRSITNGMGLRVLAFILLRAVTGQIRQVPRLLNVVGACFLVHFMLDLIGRALGV